MDIERPASGKANAIFYFGFEQLLTKSAGSPRRVEIEVLVGNVAVDKGLLGFWLVFCRVQHMAGDPTEEPAQL